MFGDALIEMSETESVRRTPPRLSKKTSITSFEIPKESDIESSGNTRSSS